jgi:hypothetical protein
LEEKVVAPVKKTENMAIEILCADHARPSAKGGTNFAKKLWLLGQYSSLVD